MVQHQRAASAMAGGLTMPNRPALLVLIGLCVLLWAFARACAPHPAQSSGAGSTIYAPFVGVRGRCDYRADPWDCHMMTATARAAATPTPTRSSATWAPSPYEPMGRAWLPILAGVAGPGVLCSAAPAGPRTVWLASHCLTAAPWRLLVDGLPVTSWQRDAGGRDLAQLEAAGGWSVPALAHLVIGDSVVMRPARGPVGGVYAGDAWADRSADGYYMTEFERPGTRAVGAVCADVGAFVRMGDSGGGVYRASDGALGGIVVASEAWAGDSDVWCGGGQVVVVVPLP